jgi:DNA-binding transcriptional regulator YdaS (Cro superfamily)
MAVPVHISTRNKTTPKRTKLPAELSRAIAFTGIFTRVASSLGVSSTHVLQVAKGRRQSSRVVAAIISEVRRIERSTQERAA